MAAEYPGHIALRAIDDVLAQKPHKDDSRLSTATGCLCVFRDHVIDANRGPDATGEGRKRLAHLNSVLRSCWAVSSRLAMCRGKSWSGHADGSPIWFRRWSRALSPPPRPGGEARQWPTNNIGPPRGDPPFRTDITRTSLRDQV
jgi:hypothetical protein